jgi:hypothetical protein
MVGEKRGKEDIYPIFLIKEEIMESGKEQERIIYSFSTYI